MIGRGTPTAALRNRNRSPGDDPYADDRFSIELRSKGLRIEREVFMLGFEWGNLAAFFTDLADSWHGWHGEKSWESVEHDLKITASSDSTGHCLMTFTVQDGPMFSWRAEVSGFRIDAGEGMAALARSVHEFIGDSPAD